MQVLAPVDNIRFDIEDALDKQTYATAPLPFTGIDKSSAAVCEFFIRSTCHKGNQCPFRHVRGDKSVLCKHWLRGLCKKGDDCEFLHEYDMNKMPECYFYSKFAQCGNKECEFLHLDPESKIKDCPWYDRGFCRHGPNCKNRHNRKVLCQNYLCGLCPDGPSCKFKHPKFDLPVPDSAMQQKKQLYQCDFCGEYGHKVSSCFKLNPENRQIYQQKHHHQSFSQNPGHQQQATHNTNGNFNGNGPHSAHLSNGNNEPPQLNQNQNYNPQQRQYGYNPHYQNQRYQGQYHNNYQNHYNNNQGGGHPVPPQEVTCFKCGDKGHYANKCTKGVYAFLRSSSNDAQNQNK